VVAAVVVVVTVLAWWATWSGARSMGLLMRLGVPMSIGMEGRADLTSFAVFTAMWAVMMIAMMLPSSYPTLLLHRTVYNKRTPHQFGGTLLFATAYFAVWTASAVLFYFAYVAIGHIRLLQTVSDLAILRIAGIALISAGIYQWTQLKLACLRHCQTPLQFIIHHWRDGKLGAIRMGATHALYCFACCWGLMLVLFVMGVMHIGWMAIIGSVILLERLTTRSWIPRATGSAMIVIGVVALISPATLTRLSSQITIG
jgi:predicted metal-binding membrane protein